MISTKIYCFHTIVKLANYKLKNHKSETIFILAKIKYNVT